MIAKLKGLVDTVGEDWAVIDVGGVGYLVSCSGRTLARLDLGRAVSLSVETWVREDAIQLFGFAEPGERDWFRLLTTVQGVGAKVALAILTVASPDQILRTIAAQDKAPLVRASGVGPRLAARILSELKDKAVAAAAMAPAAASEPGVPAAPVVDGAGEDAVSALVNLGYRRLEAFEAVAAARADGTADDAGQLIRAALQRLGRDILGRGGEA
jgi:Holliday junction DNA helicase RuvA